MSHVVTVTRGAHFGVDERGTRTIGNRIVSLQALRFFAAAVVVAYHSWCMVISAQRGACPVVYAIGIGTAGVDVFFVLSGFVIALTGPLAQPRPSGARFFWRRWSRVAPLFYLLSVPAILLAARSGGLSWPRTAATFLFWPAAGREIASPYLGVGWTLCFEMIFYSTVAALLTGGRLRRNLWILAAVVAALVAARSFSGWNPLRILANPVFLEFGAGAALASVWPWLRRAPVALGAVLIVAALAIFVAEAIVGVGDAIFVGPTMNDTNALWRVLVFGPPAVFLVAGAAICNRVLRGPLVAVLAWLGDASYSIYLSQEVAVLLATAVWLAAIGGGHTATGGIVVLAASIAFGAAVYVLVERPIMRAVRRIPVDRWARSSVVAAPAAPD